MFLRYLHERVLDRDGFHIFSGFGRQLAADGDLVVLVIAQVVQVEAGLVFILVLKINVILVSLMFCSFEILDRKPFKRFV